MNLITCTQVSGLFCPLLYYVTRYFFDYNCLKVTDTIEQVLLFYLWQSNGLNQGFSTFILSFTLWQISKVKFIPKFLLYFHFYKCL